MSKIYEEIRKGDFSNFNLLKEEQQIDLMKNWDRNMWIKFRLQNTVSESDVFDPIFKMIDEDE